MKGNSDSKASFNLQGDKASVLPDPAVMPPLKKMTAKTGGTYNGGSGAAEDLVHQHASLVRNDNIMDTINDVVVDAANQAKSSAKDINNPTHAKTDGVSKASTERNLSNCFWLRSNLGLVMPLVPIVRPRLG
ncbi:hypothetical protein DM860_002228 [Cuscuta australis]|uniref:Uncharacterized protein n=1 Tax=Cuscuta australis TaxID=267555 RepID=A0A328DW25_9ASTE|nr:hypothetical protein DM860_002228 [Cuscuta australis]